MRLLFITFICLSFFASCSTVNSNFNKNSYNYLDGLGVITKKLRNDLRNETQLRIAILPTLNEIGNRTLLGDNVSNVLQTGLFQSNSYTLVERERVDSLLEEYDFSMNGLVDTSSMKEIGKLLAVDTIVVGTIRDETDKFSLYIRVLDIETGKILSMANVLVTKDGNLEKQYLAIIKYSKMMFEGVYSLGINYVFLSKTNQDGYAWDAFSRPDVKLSVYVDDNEIFISNTFSAFPKIEINENIEVVLKENSILKVAFFDEDISGYEYMESITFIPDDIIKLNKEDGSIIKKGSIEELSLSIKKVL